HRPATAMVLAAPDERRWNDRVATLPSVAQFGSSKPRLFRSGDVPFARCGVVDGTLRWRRHRGISQYCRGFTHAVTRQWGGCGCGVWQGWRRRREALGTAASGGWPKGFGGGDLGFGGGVLVERGEGREKVGFVGFGEAAVGFAIGFKTGFRWVQRTID